MPKQSTIIKDLVDVAVLVNNATPYQSEVVNLAMTSGSFAVQVVYNNGTTPDVDFIVELSNDGVNFANPTIINTTATSGNVLFDFPTGSGAVSLRLRATAASGNLDIVDVLFRAKQDR